ncbi:hypothetical protein NQ166_09870 [Microbacterium sp. zg.Y1090]|uniref:hypothetical protein n=1 Tax=Microbacterium TaxID=33882 RepID=UPI00214B142C|nr:MULTISPECIES: hypothetical protein [unclassified Microbacterium]MCR2811449.1 hypothetical protein [Microbacterium sp. zg.Y1084]MCR2819133.1 hypothetical protein [Microbacterium sp. zg.Y1090]WIM27435.1 hypothetical protein QNO26_09685 [Microbacterium sp. zg-Y1090]
MTDDRIDDSTATTSDHSTDAPHGGATAEQDTTGTPVQYGVGPFSVREVALIAVWVLAFVVSFFSLYHDPRLEAGLGLGGSVWNAGLDWILTIGVPTVAVFLIVLRRFSPDGIRRVGSLGIDQFASVAFSVSATVWLAALWTNVARGVQSGIWLSSWVVWVEFFLMLAGVVLTVFAPLIPALAEDFQHRREVPAHRNARPLRPVTPRPRTPRPASSHEAQPADAAGATPPAAVPAGYASAPGGSAPAPRYDVPADDASRDASAPAGTPADDVAAFGENPDVERSYDDEPFASAAVVDDGETEAVIVTDSEEAVIVSAPDDVDETAALFEDAGPASAATEPFWALVPVERDVVDDQGMPLFRIGPTAWALVIEDRDETFVVRHEDGRVGYLHDTSGVTRG